MIPSPAQVWLSLLLALGPAVAEADPPALPLPAPSLAPVEVKLVPAAPTPWRMSPGSEIGGPDPGGPAPVPGRESALPPWRSAAAPALERSVIPAPTAATLLDPFVVRDDRFRRLEEAIDSTRISEGRFSVATGGRLATVRVGFINFDLGMWKHEAAGPSFGPPTPVVDLIKFTW